MKDYRPLIDGSRRGWLDRGKRLGLWLGSHPYGWGVGVKNRRFDSGRVVPARAGVPVISVGNLTAGGTGKTPMVAAIALHLRARELRVALVSRGYKSDATGSNDEAQELYDLLPDVPHIQNPDRIEAARVAVEELEMQAILLDDGFQHRRLHRDLDVVLIDATCPFGYGYLLPRGLLREPIKNLSRADVVVISRAGRVDTETLGRLDQQLRRLAPGAVHAQCDHSPTQLVDADGKLEAPSGLRDRPVAAFAGIGNPGPFFESLKALGGRLVETRALADHCVFNRATIDDLTRWLAELKKREPELVAVCTMKDLVKLRTTRLANTPLMALRVELKMTAGEPEFWRAIDLWSQDS